MATAHEEVRRIVVDASYGVSRDAPDVGALLAFITNRVGTSVSISNLVAFSAPSLVVPQVDPWGRPYQMAIEDVQVTSAGASVDITVWSSGADLMDDEDNVRLDGYLIMVFPEE